MRRLSCLTLLLPLALAAGPAEAGCPAGGEVFLGCTFRGGARAVDVCLEGNEVSYRFGPPGGAAELALRVPVAELDYTPWPGIGRHIWETVTFHNGDVSYAVTGGLRRMLEGETEAEVAAENFGEIRVLRGDAELAVLNCDAGSLDFGFSKALSDAKAAAGQCWDHAEVRWSACN